jgi:hypothetical protein
LVRSLLWIRWLDQRAGPNAVAAYAVVAVAFNLVVVGLFISRGMYVLVLLCLALTVLVAVRSVMLFRRAKARRAIR